MGGLVVMIVVEPWVCMVWCGCELGVIAWVCMVVVAAQRRWLRTRLHAALGGWVYKEISSRRSYGSPLVIG